MWWKFILVAFIGIITGFLTASLCQASGRATSIYDAYNEGYIDGRKSLSEDK